MLIQKLILGLTTLFMATAGLAETFEIQMLNKGETGRMVFEPAYLAVAPGDTVTFVPASKGHNAETIKGMIPDGARRPVRPRHYRSDVRRAAPGAADPKARVHLDKPTGCVLHRHANADRR